MVERSGWFVALAGVSLVAASAIALWWPDVFGALLRAAAAFKGMAAREEWSSSLRTILQELMLLGAVTAAAGAALTSLHRLAALLASRRRRIAAAAALTICVQGLSAWHRRSVLLDGARVWFLDDDAMISMRYARNLADGHGLVWNVGERVEGYSNFLWTCIMAGIHRIGAAPEWAAVWVLVLNVVLSCALLVQVDRLGAALNVRGLLAAGVLLLAALSRELLVWSLSGLEAVALALLCTFVLARLVDRRQTGVDVPACAALALLPLVRADAIVLALLLAAAGLAIHRDIRRTAVLGAAAMVPFAIHLLLRREYYGEWLPNTAYLKVGGWDGRLGAGGEYVLRFFLRHAAAAALVCIAVMRGEHRRLTAPLGAVLAIYAGYVVYLGGDAFPGGRFFVPLMPLLFALAMAGASALESQAARRSAVAALLLTTPLLWHNRYWQPLPAFVTALLPSPGDVGNVAIARWIRDHTPREAVVADYWAGSTFYFSARRGVDLLGKMDPVVARTTAVCDSGLPGHNKYDFNHSLARLKPDFVVAGFKLLDDGTLRGPSGERLPAEDRSPCRMFGALYEHGVFRSRYLPHVAANEGWRTVFTRRP